MKTTEIPLYDGVPDTINRMRVAVFDVDGTLARNDSKVSAPTLEALRALNDAGIAVVVATGRPAAVGALVFEDAGFDGFVVGANGAMILHTSEAEPLFVQPLDLDYYGEMREFARRYEATFFTFGESAVYASSRGPGFDLIEEVNQGFEVRIGSPLDSGDVPIKTMFGVEEERMEVFKPLAQARFPQSSETLPGILEQGGPGVTKWEGLQIVFSRLAVDPDEALGVGDSENDLCWLPQVGISLGMGNAYPHLLEHCQYQIRDNESDGVAHFVRDWVQYLANRGVTRPLNP